MADPLYIVVKQPGEEPVARMVEDKLESYQKIVGGYIELVVAGPPVLPEGLYLFCNEEGKLIGLGPNIRFQIEGYAPEIVSGTCYIAGEDGESLTPQQLETAGKWLKERTV